MSTVLAIAAFDRSGTTFLGKYIHQVVADSLFIGELDKGLVFLTTDSVARSCSCGKRILECEVWSGVSAVVKNGTEKQQGIIPSVFATISERQHSDLMIDSSKSLSHMRSLVETMRDNVFLLHVVRNPKGVIYSRMKARMRRVGKGSHPKPHIARRYNLMMIYDSFAWALANIYIETILKRKATRYERIFYECSPRDLPPLLERIKGNRLGERNERQHHIIHGNRNRYAKEDEIVIDESWRENLTRPQKWAVDFITWPVRTAFGYRFEPINNRS